MAPQYKLYAEIHPELAPDFAMRAERLMKAAVKKSKAVVGLEIDKRQAVREVKASLKELEKVAELKVKLKFDKRQTQRDFSRFTRQNNLRLSVGTRLDRTSARRTTREVESFLSRVFEGNAKNSLIDFSRVVNASMTALKVGAVAALPPIVALGGSLATAAASAAAIGPALIAAGAQGLVLKGIFSEVTEAFKYWQAAQKVGAADKAVFKASESYKKLTKTQKKFVDQQITISEKMDKFNKGFADLALPGVTKLLKALTDDPKKNSLLDIFANKGNKFSRSFGNFAARLGELAKDKTIKDAFGSILDDGDKAFNNFGDAALKAIKPVARIFKAASPLVVRFSENIEDLTDKFARFIGKKSDADLKKYFEDAGTELGKWWRVAKNVLATIKNVLQLSAPSGSNLVERLGVLTDKMREFTENPEGQKKIKEFFTFFQNLNYGDIAKTAGSLTALATAMAVLAKIKAGPVQALMAALIIKDPEGFAKVVDKISDVLVPALSFMVDHENALIAVLGALAGLKVLGALKGLNLKNTIPGLGGAGGLGDKIVQVSKDLRPNSAGNPIWVTLTLPDKKGLKTVISGGLPKAGGGIAVVVTGITAGVLTALGIKGATKTKTEKGIYQRYIPGVNAPLTPDQQAAKNRLDYPKGSGGILKVETTASKADKSVWDRIYDTLKIGGPIDKAVDKGAKATGDWLSKHFKEMLPWTKEAKEKMRREQEADAKKGNGERLLDAILKGLSFAPLGGKAVGGVVTGIKEIVKRLAGAGAAMKAFEGSSVTSLNRVTNATDDSFESIGKYTSALLRVPSVAETEVQTPGLLDGIKNFKGLLDNIDLLPNKAGTAVENPGLLDGISRFKNLFDRIDMIPGKSATTVETPGMPKAQSEFSSLLDKVRDTMGKKLITLTTSGYSDVLGKLTKLEAAQTGLEKANTTIGGAALKRAAGGHVRGPGGPTADKIPAMLSNGEYVIRAKAVKALMSRFGSGILDKMNHAEKFADGGSVGAGAGRLAASNVADRFPFTANLAKTAIPKMLDMLGGLGGGQGWQWQMNTLRKVFPGLGLLSGFRPGAITSTGNRSYHSLGRAVDLPPRWDVFNWISKNYGKKTKELIFTPAGSRQIKNGRNHVFTGGTIQRDHYNHVHWAFKNGGLVGDTRKYREAAERAAAKAKVAASKAKAKTAAYLKRRAVALKDAVSGKVSRANLKLIRGVGEDTLANWAKTLSHKEAEKLYSRLQGEQKQAFVKAYATRLEGEEDRRIKTALEKKNTLAFNQFSSTQKSAFSQFSSKLSAETSAKADAVYKRVLAETGDEDKAFIAAQKIRDSAMFRINSAKDKANWAISNKADKLKIKDNKVTTVAGKNVPTQTKLAPEDAALLNRPIVIQLDGKEIGRYLGYRADSSARGGR